MELHVEPLLQNMTGGDRVTTSGQVQRVSHEPAGTDWREVIGTFEGNANPKGASSTGKDGSQPEKKTIKNSNQ